MARRIRLLAVLAMLVALPALAHDVKDPVCRMTVDSDTAKYRHRLGRKSFYFCSKQCQVKFAAEPARYEKLAAQLEKQDLHEYEVLLGTSPNPTAGKPVELAFTIRYAKSKALVREYELIHERLFHLLLVSDDLSRFEHQHPSRGADGIFRKTWTFPRPGRYTLYADFTPADGDNQVKPLPLVVGGGPEKTVALTAESKLVKQVGDYRVELQLRPGLIRMEKPVVLTYTIRDRAGRPMRDMQPFIGAPGHLIAISQDREQVIHTHAIHGSADKPAESGAVHVTPAMSTEKGPAFSFKLTTPTAGLYRVWAQFMHRNRVLTVPWTLDVQELWARMPPPRPKVCPVMKNPVPASAAPSLLVNHVPMLFCCAGCGDAVKKAPAAYLKTPVKDPVTGRAFRVTRVTPKLEHAGGLFLFSSPATRERFRREPSRYARP
jgi:YHS domain-containing protein